MQPLYFELSTSDIIVANFVDVRKWHIVSLALGQLKCLYIHLIVYFISDTTAPSFTNYECHPIYMYNAIHMITQNSMNLLKSFKVMTYCQWPITNFWMFPYSIAWQPWTYTRSCMATADSGFSILWRRTMHIFSFSLWKKSIVTSTCVSRKSRCSYIF